MATREKLERFLHHAGHYHRSVLTEYLASRNALILGWTALVVTFIATGTEPGDGLIQPTIIVGLVGLACCFAVPRLILEAAAKSRLQRIESDLPDALDMISMCMTGGLPLQVALVRVSGELKHSHPDLAYELGIMGRQMEAGSFDGAVRRFAQRIATPEVQALTGMIRQTDSQGASVTSSFLDFADNIRLTRRQRADEQGNKTALKMLFPLVFCLAPAVYLMLLAPAAIELKTFVQREATPGGILSVSPEEFGDVLQGTTTVGGSLRQLPTPEAIREADSMRSGYVPR
jgi:tight adherence protein C